MKKFLLFASFASFALIAGCSETVQSIDGRWYSQAQVISGAVLFNDNCATCHGSEAQGIVPDWRQVQADGSYPPPPLNGSAHAWHHPVKMLKSTIRNGGIPVGGVMPPFKDQLNDEQIDSVIAYFQSRWSDKIYSAWLVRTQQSR